MRIGAWLAVLLVLSTTADAQTPTRVELSDDGQLRQGSLILTPRDLFVLAGRTDLVERSDRNLVRRRWLIASSAVVFVAATIVGSVVLALTPDINKPYCVSTVARYNECLGYVNLYNHGGIAILGGGALVAGLLGALGWWSRPEVLSKSDLWTFVDEYNALH